MATFFLSRIQASVEHINTTTYSITGLLVKSGDKKLVVIKRAYRSVEKR